MGSDFGFRKGAVASEWIERARCIDEDPELFFPVGTTGSAIVQTERAIAICLECPVRRECLTWALETAQDAGVWGGLSEEDRREIRRRRRREAAFATSRTAASDLESVATFTPARTGTGR
jgi:WhiB family transcriptional regulator, redox-sensing transcriptional regulator